MKRGAMRGWRGSVAAAVVAAAGARSAPPLHAGSADEALSSRLQRIEGAFRGDDAGALRASFAGNCKVRVDLKDLTDGPASYGPGQLQVVFEHIFEEHRTREFSFRRPDVSLSPPGTAFAKGRWVRQARTGGQETVDALTFTLREEDHDWRIQEIVTSR
jgi:hypothetical protein